MQALVVATVLVAGGVTYYVVHQQHLAACRPAVQQANALWAQASAIMTADMNAPLPTGPQSYEQVTQPQRDAALSDEVFAQADAVVLAHPSCFSSFQVSDAHGTLRR